VIDDDADITALEADQCADIGLHSKILI
jgi:hypothetical protein